MGGFEMSAVSGWNPKRLTELADYINGYAFKPEDWGKEGLPIIRIEQLKNPSAPTDYFSGKLPPSRIINDGDLIFSWSASLFLRIWHHGKAALNQHLFKVVERDEVDRLFLKAFIDFYLPELTAASHGSTMQHITRKELDRFGALFPESKPEQTKIAEILSTVDRAIEQTEALIAKQQRLKTGLMQDLLTRGIDEHGNLRSEQTHQFKDSPLGRIPVEWEVVSLQSMASRQKHAFVDGPFGSNLKTIHYRESGVPIIQSGFVTDGTFSASTYLYVDESKFRSEIRSKVVAGDIVMAKIGARCGTCAILPADHQTSIIAGNCIKITVSPDNVTEYVLACLQHEYSRSKFEDYISTTAQPAVNMPALKAMPVKRPTLDEQHRIVECLASSESDLHDHRRRFNKLHSLKTALMQDLLTGRKRVTELLKRKEVNA